MSLRAAAEEWNPSPEQCIARAQRESRIALVKEFITTYKRCMGAEGEDVAGVLGLGFGRRSRPTVFDDEEEYEMTHKGCKAKADEHAALAKETVYEGILARCMGRFEGGRRRKTRVRRQRKIQKTRKYKK